MVELGSEWYTDPRKIRRKKINQKISLEVRIAPSFNYLQFPRETRENLSIFL